MQLRSRKLPRDAVHHPVFARFYARFSVAADLRGGVAAYREELLSGLSGRVIEVGAGNGLNFAHYPGAVSEVVALEPERSLRQLAVRAALRAEVPVDVVPGAAEALRNRGLGCRGVVIGSMPAEPDLASRCNIEDLPVAAGAPLLGAVPAGAGALPGADFAAGAVRWLAPELGGSWTPARG